MGGGQAGRKAVESLATRNAYKLLKQFFKAMLVIILCICFSALKMELVEWYQCPLFKIFMHLHYNFQKMV